MKLRKSLMPFAAAAVWGFGQGALAHGTDKAAMNVPHATITFDNGSSMLSDSDKSMLRKMITDARASGELKRVDVAAWSDKELPAMDQKLSDADRDLAKKRADAIKDYLKSAFDVSSVETFNMAESSNWLARNFHTRDAELKSVFGKTGAAPPVTQDEFKCIQRDGGPSKGIAAVEWNKMEGTSAPANAEKTY